jgi:hypothetical protein
MQFRKSTALLLGSVLSIVMAMAPASAATLTFDWTLTSTASAALGGVPSPGSGTITVSTGIGDDTVTAITGTLGGATISGLAPIGTLFNNDNLLFPVGTTFTGPPVVSGTHSYVSASNLDTKGVAVTTALGTFDIFGAFVPNATDVTPGNNYDEFGPTGFGVGTFALTATPLPATLPLFAGGLGFVGYLTRRRNNRSSKQASSAV